MILQFFKGMHTLHGVSKIAKKSLHLFIAAARIGSTATWWFISAITTLYKKDNFVDFHTLWHMLILCKSE